MGLENFISHAAALLGTWEVLTGSTHKVFKGAALCLALWSLTA